MILAGVEGSADKPDGREKLRLMLFLTAFQWGQLSSLN